MTEITSTQQVTLTAAFTNSRGQPADVEGTPAWSTDNTDALTLVPAADGLTCLVKAAGPLTDLAKVTCTGDADLGDGVAEVKLSHDIKVVAAQATTGTVTAGTPEEQPAEDLGPGASPSPSPATPVDGGLPPI
jgi:hypothetical protein